MTTNCVSDGRNSFVVQEQGDRNTSISLNSHEIFDPFVEIESNSSKIVITDPHQFRTQFKISSKMDKRMQSGVVTYIYI